MAARVTFRRRNPYNTKSNSVKQIKTPGGKIRVLHLKKKGTAPKCGETGVQLPGVKALRPREYANVPRRDRSVNRAYGGTLCGAAVKDRIIRAFLIEEQKIVKRVVKEKLQAAAAAEKKSAKKSKK